MKFFNTKTRKKEEFKPLNEREVKIYYCGPTVYNYAHIWNLRTFIFEDIVVKTLKFLWYNTKTVMNLTDVDDKTINASIKQKQTLKELTKKYSEFFLQDIKKLWIQKANEIVPVTWVIPEMVRMINTMLRRKNAYLSDDWSIYFDIKSFKKYWKFANLDTKWMKSWVRIDNDEYEKDDAFDFVLWKTWKKSDWDNFWEEEFEINWKKIILKWRPGWHIECSAVCMKYFWQQIDIHMWWVDLIFPHHQNEIAQTESCTRKEFSRYWLHSWHLMVNWKKMSKSLWNFYTLKDIEEKYLNSTKKSLKISESILYRAIRLSFINAKYSSQIDFSFSKLESNFSVIKSIDEILKLVDREIKSWEKKLKWVSRDFREYMQEIMQEYIFHLEDDFNIPDSLALLFSFIKYINTWIRENTFSLEELKSINEMFKNFSEILWIFDYWILEKTKEIPSEILQKFEKRNQAKNDKNFELADKLRNEILNLWYKIIDSKEGSRLEKI